MKALNVKNFAFESAPRLSFCSLCFPKVLSLVNIFLFKKKYYEYKKALLDDDRLSDSINDNFFTPRIWSQQSNTISYFYCSYIFFSFIYDSTLC